MRMEIHAIVCVKRTKNSTFEDGKTAMSCYMEGPRIMFEPKMSVVVVAYIFYEGKHAFEIMTGACGSGLFGCAGGGDDK